MECLEGRNMNLTTQRKNLVRKILWKWSEEVPQVKNILANKDLSQISEKECELICDILVRELTATGLDDDSEPTSRGLELEAAIDWIRAVGNKPLGERSEKWSP